MPRADWAGNDRRKPRMAIARVVIRWCVDISGSSVVVHLCAGHHKFTAIWGKRWWVGVVWGSGNGRIDIFIIRIFLVRVAIGARGDASTGASLSRLATSRDVGSFDSSVDKDVIECNLDDIDRSESWKAVEDRKLGS